MSRILAYTSPARGHLFPLVPILDELTARGHDVSLRTLECEVERMRQKGFRTEAVSPAVEGIPLDDFQGRTPIENVKRSVTGFSRRAPHDAEDLRKAIEEVDPDFVLVDVNAWGAGAVAEAWGGAWATWCPFPLPISSIDTPPYGPGLPPAGGVLGRLRDALLRPLVVRPLEKAMVPPMNEIRANLGLPPIRGVEGIFTAAPLTIYLTAEPFEYPRSDWPPTVRMVGPCDWDPPAEKPGWLATLDRPVVLVTTSSEFQDDGALAQIAMDALASDDVFVVVTVPSADLDGFEVPANARVERFVPHGLVLDHAVVAVTHGGMGATQKALARGIPVCAVPFGRDQHEVARRVEIAGAGTRLPARKLTAKALREKVRRARAMKHGAERIAAAYQEAGGGATAAALIESQLPR